MGKLLNKITGQQHEFIEKQKMFFVSTAANEGTVNLSPKGMDSFRIINENLIVWLNLTGSGNETSAHVQQNPRMTIMFCAFEGAPLILRLYGKAQVLHQAHPLWDEYATLFPEYTGTRQLFLMDVEHTQSSCGYGVPLYDFVEQRQKLNDSHNKQGKAGVESYWKKANQLSIDGVETKVLELSGIDE